MARKSSSTEPENHGGQAGVLQHEHVELVPSNHPAAVSIRESTTAQREKGVALSLELSY